MTHEESVDLSFWVSKLEELIKGFKVELDDLKKGFVRIVYLFNLQKIMENNMEESMGHMKNNMMERIVKLIQNLEEKFPKGDDVAKGSQENKYSVHVDKSSINKHDPIGFDSNNGSNHGRSPISVLLQHKRT